MLGVYRRREAVSMVLRTSTRPCHWHSLASPILAGQAIQSARILPPFLMLPSAPGMACGSRYSCAGVHGCRWHMRIPPQSGTTHSPSEIHTSSCIRSLGCWSISPLVHCRMGNRLCSCSVSHGQIRRIPQMPWMCIGNPDRYAESVLLWLQAVNPAPSAVCGSQGHWWCGGQYCWRQHSDHVGLWWYSYILLRGCPETDR